MEGGALNKLNIGFIIQARMQSTRLPGKILMPIPFGSELCTLDWIIDELKKFNIPQSSIYIATSKNKENDVLESFCKEKGVNCFRGDEKNVLSRYIEIASKNNFDFIVRLTGDNPLVDLKVLNTALREHFSANADYTNTKGLPAGMNMEIITTEKLLGLKHEQLSEHDKEHVTAFFKKDSKYRVNFIYPLKDKDLSNLRLTLDYPSDFLVLSSVLSIALKYDMEVGGMDLVELCLEKYPWIFEVNLNNYQKSELNSLSEELSIAIPLLKKYELTRTLSLLNKHT
ncbi:hypothetical protein OQ279_07080 [Salinimicrobium sp. MT39]|uniref:Spore coat polysaccharide biosynthesis protein SpsF n=1 Tax=Salinimicrobium profundisediminis TaxID=2994553 RepID=A0A9X3CYW9_9FLAO|nr:hypothetical protein [Salinimicrobium profundisediminis]MCX2837915.1 hypothetical protein [Salinimicrobium profundisediminis]